MKNVCDRIFAVVGLAICCAFAADVLGQSTPRRAQVLRVVQFNGDMAHLLSALAEGYGSTIGVETDPQQPRSAARVDVQDATLVDVLNAVVASVPRYQWRQNGESIEVVPVSGGTSLLDTNISKFQVTAADATDATNQLLMLPEVQ